ncbi:unnamed protein product [Strongylus vulgaris]|uniref:Carboxypeptidase activation peptide domain-containing protein n=1 Tax=Strongylus vulgaris TaxID=40348 RepID=A0A3P7J9G4_STRVU|nr:unnamed protein product [Strongylus vulgaris]
MVSPSFIEKFTKFLDEHGYPYHIAIEDLKKSAYFHILTSKNFCVLN